MPDDHFICEDTWLRDFTLRNFDLLKEKHPEMTEEEIKNTFFSIEQVCILESLDQ